MTLHDKKIVGVYDTEQEAIAVIDNLLHQGYHKQDISVIGKEVSQVTEETGAAAEDSAAAGALTGGALGGITGLLAGAGALAIPGIGPFIAAGPIATSLLGIAAGASLGGLTGALIGMGIPDEEAKYYENSVHEGKILVLLEKGVTDIHDRNYLSSETQQQLSNTHNGSMTQNYDDVKQLGNEMNQSKTGSELREERLTSDPLQ